MTTDISLGILCGGQSSRMGRDKGLVDFWGGRLIDFVIAKYRNLGIPLYLVLHCGQVYEDIDIPVLFDQYLDRSSLAGIYSALRQSSTDYNLLIACDMPFIPLALLELLISRKAHYDVIVPVTAFGSGYQPLCAIYHKNCLSIIEEHLKRGQLTVYEFYAAVNTLKIDPVGFGRLDEIFFNINTSTELDRALKKDGPALIGE